MSITAGQFFTNQNLFSTNYLENRLPETDLWKEADESAAQILQAVTAAYHDIRSLKLGPGEEASLEDRFIRPIFKALGFTWHVQPVTQRGSKKKRPDYALFASEADLKTAREEKDNLQRFFSQALTIAEAKYWDRPLNDMVNVDALDSRDATAQLVKYLDDVHYHSNGKILWGILTNGRLWRLFYYRATSRSGNFYQVDLQGIIRSGNVDACKYFSLFFARDAFIKDAQTGRSWLDQHLDSSEAYAKDIGEKLKDRIFDKVFERLAEGFLEYRRKERGITTEDESTLTYVFNGCLTLLYRLLFILYAEARELLPVGDEHRYYRKSLRKLQLDVLDDLHRVSLDHMSRNAHDYWARLESLCRIIDKGDKALNVPTYNGGLFQSSAPDEDQSPEARAIRFIRDHKLADPFLAEAIEALTADDDPAEPGQHSFIDYPSLGVRHLGDIYEGLLEFHVRVAMMEMAEVREKGRAVWKPLSEVKNPRHRRKHPGEVYIENSRHERRATGSYFTPHYIVEYIVKHAVGPVLEERLTKVRTLLEEYEELQKKAHRQKTPGTAQVVRSELLGKEKEIFDTLFSLKVLDPAMGSGHFLVHTVDFIADRIIAFLAEYPENPVIRRIEEIRAQILEDVKDRQGVEIDEAKLTEVNLIKRMVMKSCIYGVDLNPMAVELAKLSLWLDSFTLGAPLSFLDHHLKCGNSLIGARDVQAVAADKHFFHWELEFPEAFFEGYGEKEDPGFDAVVGNPPWGANLDATTLKSLRTIFEAHGWNDGYAFFMQLATTLVRRRGISVFLTPSSWLTVGIYEGVRRYLFREGAFKEICYLYRVFDDVNLDEAVYFHQREKSSNSVRVCIAPPDLSPSHRLAVLEKKGWAREYQSPETVWREGVGYKIDILTDPETRSIVEKVRKVSDEVKINFEVGIGIQAYCQPKHTPEQIQNRVYHLHTRKDDTYMPCLSGNDVGRYEIVTDQIEFLSIGPWLYCSPQLEVFNTPRLLAQQVIWKTLKTCMVTQSGIAHYNSIFHVRAPRNGYRLFFLQALLNSTFIAWIFPLLSNKTFGDKFPKLSHGDLSTLPICRINFITPEKERVQLMEKGKKLYERCLAKGDQACVLGFVDHALKQTPEQADVVHDLLAFLAEQMIEMNKAKQGEVKDFLGWLEREIGAKVEDLKNKTKLKGYHDGAFEVLLEVLKENHRALSFDPGERKFQERLANEYADSLAKLGPLKARLGATDRLIDQIVYKLYGLTEEEIKIVETGGM